MIVHFEHRKFETFIDIFRISEWSMTPIIVQKESLFIVL